SGTIVVTYRYTVDGFLGALSPSVLVRINDDDAPTALIRETGGSTDVIEAGALPNVSLERLNSGVYAGTISVNGERDNNTVLLIAGRTYTCALRVAQSGEGTLNDPYLPLYSNSDLVTPVAENDDSNA